MGRATFLTALAAALAACGTIHAQDDPYSKALRAAGISTQREALGEYLLNLVPSEENRRRAKELVQQLGDADFQVREAAHARLNTMPDPPVAELKLAAEADDPEIRFRARQILMQVEGGAAGHAGNTVVGYILHHRVCGLVGPLLEYMPHANDNSPYGMTARAVRATVTKEDVDLLRKAIGDGPAFRQAAAVLALADVLEKVAIGELIPLSKHEQRDVRLAAAEALANLGSRAALPPLVRLLDDEDASTRARGAELLRQFTRQRFEYIAYGDPEDRAAAARRWQQWVIDHGATAELYFPLAEFEVFLGRTLMSIYPGTLREIDAEGKQRFEKKGFQYVWGCHGTPDGHRLVVDFSRKYLLEFDETGEVVLRLDNLPGPPSDVQRLESGNLLLALAEANRVVEMNRSGEVVWSVSLKGRPTTANRLANGNTVVNLQFAKKVVEVDPAGEIVWQLDGLDNALTAQALSNGNVLVCEMEKGEAVEYNRAGQKVWRKAGFSNACQAQRLTGGNTLVSDDRGLHEFTPDGVKVWSIKVPRGRFWRY